MNILSINNVAKIGREEMLFTGVTFGLNEGDKAALIGRNGIGKSTLLGTIAGVLAPDEGTIVINKESGVSFLPQSPAFNSDDTIRDHIFKSNSPKLSIIRDFLETCEQLANPKAGDGVHRRYDQLNEQMEKQDLWNYEAQVSSILSTLGINDLNKTMGTLSGGMVKKVALAQVLVEDTKLLLLDEPTNHLDITTITWLQNYLRDTKRTVLMVTHDRYFLDAVCNNIFELARNKIKLYQGNYSTYLEKKEIEAEIERNTDRRIESVLRFERDWLSRGPCARGTKAKARIQRDMQLINREKFKEDKGFSFEVQGRRLGGKVLELHSISKSYTKSGTSVPVISDFSYTFTKGQKIGIFGDNGSGKSTFLNIITGQLPPDTGSVVVGENTFFGYYMQNPVFKDLSLPVLDYIKEAAENVTKNDGKTLSAGQFLNEFGFEGKILHSPLSSLSGGERKRLFLIRLLMTNPNFLILDEPTNDFDIFTMNVLEQFLMQYQGCLLVVSHDRYFMDKVADTMFILEDDGNISGFVGKCSEYIELRDQQKREQLLNEREQKREEKKDEKTAAALRVSEENSVVSDSERINSCSPAPRKRTWKEQKEFESLESEILELEEKKSALEAKMSSGEKLDFESLSREYNILTSELEGKYSRWEELGLLS
ncbi:MAG: ABC-F family ATP-binding cassette domain-containing protein [Treponema sp.]|nr:ABC-F family ATP-binding cassette domain-containing protein [Treponema sp.]